MKPDAWPIRAQDVLLAITLLTRLPAPKLQDATFAQAARAVWAYPLVGGAIGLVAGAAGLMSMWLGLGPELSAGIVLACLALTTGAMHEDGLADTADGLWGGWDVERRLEIMKDSQIGTYGVLALLLIVGLRWGAYTMLLPMGAGGVIATAALSRAMMPGVMVGLPHARADGLSRSVGRPGSAAAIFSLGLGFVLAGALIGWAVVPCLLLALCAGTGVGLLAKSRIKGQTGDILGATQQVSETVILLTLVALWT